MKYKIGDIVEILLTTNKDPEQIGIIIEKVNDLVPASNFLSEIYGTVYLVLVGDEKRLYYESWIIDRQNK